MGQSSSNRRNNQNHNRPVSPSQLLSSSSSSSSSSFSSSNPPPSNAFPGFPPPAPPPAAAPLAPSFPGFSAAPPTYAPAANYPYPSPPYRPRPPPPPNFYSQYPPLGNRPNYSYCPNQNHGWPQFHASSSQAVPATPPPPLVEHQKATTVRNDVNLHKQTIRLEMDEQNPDTHLVTFTFDAAVDGSITIFYFAKEGTSCRFSPLYPDNFVPVTASFQKGPNQKFRQPIGTGIDLGFFVLEDLGKPTSDNVFPLVISAEACSPPLPTDEQLGQPPAPGNAQITEAVIEKKNGETFEVKVVRQILWFDGVRYELREIFGIEKSSKTEFDDDDPGKECVICLSEPKDTAVLPCRHLCMCSECAKVLKFQMNRCPICRQPVEELIEINIKKG
ncbi:hypothetical protein MRB53_031178 [Persea americana]|uniref:Uncharacterized protein n=1 Tax=Persea americana TaxID=3435 RepID=A0ACC2KNT3_PERAE|nr:hypothetical protein MRB53_031178 [Persea americana]